jgi:hypothetical protein
MLASNDECDQLVPLTCGVTYFSIITLALAYLQDDATSLVHLFS